MLMTGMHHFDGETYLCRYCGCSMSAAIGAGVGCYPDTTNLVSFKHHQALKELEEALEQPDEKVIDMITGAFDDARN